MKTSEVKEVFRSHGGIKHLSEGFDNLITTLSALKEFLVHTFLPQTFSEHDMFCYVMVFKTAKHEISLGFLKELFKNDTPRVHFM